MRRHPLCLAGAAALAVTLSACGDSGDEGSPDACSAPDSTLTVGALDALTFDAESYDAGAGCLEITYANEGSVAHTLLVRGESGFKLRVGDTDTGTITLDAGTYELFCDIAGHEAAGMVAELTVS